MDKNKKMRNSNFELLRIICMFMIVLYHTIERGNILNNAATSDLYIFFLFFYYFALFHVNSFVLMTGYFQCDKKFSSSKIWKLLNASLFYKIIVIMVLGFFGLLSLSKFEILKQIFILNLDQYWFVKIYVILYSFSPFINKLIDNLDKKSYINLLLLLFFWFSIIPSITGRLAFDNSGFTLYHFVFLYLVGAFLRKYPLKLSYIFNRTTKNLYRIIMAFIFFGALIINFSFYISSKSILDTDIFLKEICSNIIYSSHDYANPLVIIQSLACFCFFETLSFKSKFINKLSSLAFGVYLIHDNNFIFPYLYKWLKIDNGLIYSYKFIFYVFLIVILIYVCSTIIEFLRQVIFKFIYNFKISIRIRNSYNKFISSIF